MLRWIDLGRDLGLDHEVVLLLTNQRRWPRKGRGLWAEAVNNRSILLEGFPTLHRSDGQFSLRWHFWLVLLNNRIDKKVFNAAECSKTAKPGSTSRGGGSSHWYEDAKTSVCWQTRWRQDRAPLNKKIPDLCVIFHSFLVIFIDVQLILPAIVRSSN